MAEDRERVFPSNPRVAAVVVAAGRGERFGAGAPKQTLPVAGKPLARRAVEALLAHPGIDMALCVLPNDPVDAALVGKALGSSLDHIKAARPAAGGERRQDSVLAGLRALPKSVEIVAVHDAARPFPPAEGISRAIRAVDEGGGVDGAILAVPVADTLKLASSDGAILETVDRSNLRAAQTPQVFRRAALEQALEAAGDKNVTDEAQAIERFGKGKVVWVEGSPENFKVTWPGDLQRAELIVLSRRGEAGPGFSGAPGASELPPPAPARPEFAAGFGYDVHALVEGRPLILGGVRIEHDKGLDGHSDADVLAHALTDAVLGAAGLGDIGQHFPPDDDAWKGADSIELLRLAWEKVAAKGWRLGNADATIAAQRPKLAPHAKDMAERLASAMSVAPGRVHVKATTTERLGFAGREEGIAAYAMAVLWKP